MKIALVVDKPGWAYDFVANDLIRLLSDQFEFKIFYVQLDQKKELEAFKPNLIHVMFWGETWHHFLNFPVENTIKEISSYRWMVEDQYGKISPSLFVKKYLYDCGRVCTTSKKMYDLIWPHKNTTHTPNGVFTDQFFNKKNRSGELQFGWVGNINDKTKGVAEILIPAFEINNIVLKLASGDLKRHQMNDFYNEIDVLCVASIAEGQPLTIMESMATGCFQLSNDVGIAKELIIPFENGLIPQRTVESYAVAINWCKQNVEFIRGKQDHNVKMIMSKRSWHNLKGVWTNFYSNTLGV